MTTHTASTCVDVAGLKVARVLHDFVIDELLPGTGVASDKVWAGLAAIIADLGPQNAALLARRTELQAAIDRWHRERRGLNHDAEAYWAFLEQIGYLEPEGPPFEIETTGIDAEVAEVAGPQLIVPLMNARYALNAANARWGSLYDALYGTDATGSPPVPGPYDRVRGAKVIAWVRRFLDDVVPLAAGSHADAVAYRVDGSSLAADLGASGVTGLRDGAELAGYTGPPDTPTSVLLRHHGLHIELRIDRAHPVGTDDTAGIADVVLESAVTVVMDCEDAVAAVDAEDKVAVYRNWLGLMRGDLAEDVPKDGGVLRRRLAGDRRFTAPDGSTFELRGRALMFIRNVGHLMTTDAVLDSRGNEVPEGMLDALITVLGGVHDLRHPGGPRNSRALSVYVVKPKIHGPAEVAFADELFTRVEAVLGLPRSTVKIGLMDEERRTSLNLHECIRAARTRIAFINTGFLDRTGDEIHTSMEAGPVVRKAEMKTQPWLAAYEDRNVAVGLACGFRGRAQIGKGMWAAPDLMRQMLDEKIAHPVAGADCAWVPSPTAATLHATHYHRVDVAKRQAVLAASPPGRVEELLTIPVSATRPTPEEVRNELDNNAQGILGYAVRWVDQGVGCSKVPDINGVALMEDRATCRISSQHIANWLRHGVVERDDVLAALWRMAAVVDAQNADDPGYEPMAPACDGPAFLAARELVLSGTEQPSGYTEPILHARRKERKTRRGDA